MRIVIDTSVVVAALLNPGGASWALLEVVLAEHSQIESCLSLALSLEYRDVLGRSHVLEKTSLPSDDIQALLDALESVATKIDPLLRVGPSGTDPADHFVVELVVNARADRLVTYNIRDFTKAATAWGFVVSTPGALLHELRKA